MTIFKTTPMYARRRYYYQGNGILQVTIDRVEF